MALDRLLAALERETDERAAAVVRAAEEDAARIRASAAAECRRQRERRLAASEQQLRAESRQAIAAARHGAESRVLAARAEALERVMELARQRLPELLASTASRERVAAAVGDAIDCAGEAAVLVRASPELVAALGERFAGRRGVRIEADAGAGTGARVQAVDGSFEIDATLEARLVRSRAALLPAIAARVASEVP